MIITEFYMTRDDGVDLYQRKSSLNVKLLQGETNETYDDPIDIDPCPYTYTETDIPIEREEEDEQAMKAAAYDIIVGGEQNDI